MTLYHFESIFGKIAKIATLPYNNNMIMMKKIMMKMKNMIIKNMMKIDITFCHLYPYFSRYLSNCDLGFFLFFFKLSLRPGVKIRSR